MPGNGNIEVNFGAFPGVSDATVTVTGEAGIVATSEVEAWVMPLATVDHTADEHAVETIKAVAYASSIVVGVGFEIRVMNTNPLAEPVEPMPHQTSLVSASATTINVKTAAPGLRGAAGQGAGGVRGGTVPRIYGRWTIGWAWA